MPVGQHAPALCTVCVLATGSLWLGGGKGGGVGKARQQLSHAHPYWARVLQGKKLWSAQVSTRHPILQAAFGSDGGRGGGSGGSGGGNGNGGGGLALPPVAQ